MCVRNSARHWRGAGAKEGPNEDKTWFQLVCTVNRRTHRYSLSLRFRVMPRVLPSPAPTLSGSVCEWGVKDLEEHSTPHTGGDNIRPLQLFFGLKGPRLRDPWSPLPGQEWRRTAESDGWKPVGTGVDDKEGWSRSRLVRFTATVGVRGSHENNIRESRAST